MQKKAIFYTTVAITLAAVVIATYSTFSTYRLTDKMEAIETRIETMNFFIKDVENDLSKGLTIAGFRSLLSFNQFISSNGEFITDVNAKFKESFLNGTIDHQPLSLMEGATFMDWANKISAEAEKVGIKFNFTVNDVKLNQSDPWSVDVELNISLEIQDMMNTSYWLRERHLTAKISIIGFEDPLYIVKSNGRVANAIIISNATGFVVDGSLQNLMAHVNNSFYVPHDDAPSFLMRLEGNLGNSTFGIESLVNVEEFQQQGLIARDRSVVDYIYFGTINTFNHRINTTPEWFKIDQSHLGFYQVTDYVI